MLPAQRILSFGLAALLLAACDGATVSGFSSGPANVAQTDPSGGGGGGNTGPG